MIDVNWLTMVTGIMLPMLVALVTARVAHPGVKATTLAVLAVVTGTLNELATVGGDVSAVDWSGSAANAVAVFLVGVGTHYGLLKPIGVTGSEGGIQRSVTGGLGSRGKHAA